MPALPAEAGTYIRAIARDLGEVLNCGGCLKSLVGERAGPFAINNSITLSEFERLAQENSLDSVAISPATVLGLPCLNVDDTVALKLANGQILPAGALDHKESSPLVLVTCNDKLIALCRRIDNGELKPEVVVANAR